MNKVTDLISKNEKMINDLQKKNDKMIKELKFNNDELKDEISKSYIYNDKYLNGKIYKLSVVDVDEYNIKSTTMTLNDISKKANEKIELIENYPCRNFAELKQRERFYIENYKKIKKINDEKDVVIIKNAKDKKEKQNSIKLFVLKCVKKTENSKNTITKTFIYQKYCDFCNDNEALCGSKEDFINYLQDLGYEMKILNGYDVFYNIVCIEENSIKSFVKKCIIKTNSNQDRITKKSVFDKYRAFCIDNSYSCSPRKELFNCLNEEGYETRVLNGYDIYYNIICKLPEGK